MGKKNQTIIRKTIEIRTSFDEKTRIGESVKKAFEGKALYKTCRQVLHSIPTIDLVDYDIEIKEE